MGECMIVLREYKIEEVAEIKNILIKEKIDDLDLNGIVFIIIVDEEIAGVSKANKSESKWMLNYLIIRENHRGHDLGDSLLRGILNKLANLEIEQIYFNSHDSYLLSKGFQQTNSKELELNITRFFSRKCKGCGGSNVL